MKKPASLFASFFGLVLLSFILLGLQYFFTIQNLSCQLNQQPCSSDIQKKLSSLKGKSLFFTDVSTEIESLLADESLSVVKMQKQLPSTIVVELSSVTQKYQVALSPNQWVTYNAAGQASFASEPGGIPTISIDINNHPELATTFNPALVELIDALEEFEISYNEIHQTAMDSVGVSLQQNLQATMPLQEVTRKVAQLKIIIDALENDVIEEPVTQIDLRFNHPVLK